MNEQNRIDISKIAIVYEGQPEGSEYAQPVSDIFEVGTLIDEDGDDLEPLHLIDLNGDANEKIDISKIAIVYEGQPEGVDYAQPLSDVFEVGTLIDEDGDDLEPLHLIDLR